MIIVDMVGWWYSRGWLWMAQQIYVVELARVVEFFSIKDLFKTLFSPFRQDVIDTSRAPVGVKLQVLGGNIISRVIGAMIRITIIIIGLFFAALLILIGFVFLILWPFLPIAPIIAFLLMIGVL